MNHPPQAVLFDFDYTLGDSSRGILECVNFAFNGMGLPRANEERTAQTIGLSLTETFKQLSGETHPSRTDQFVRLFLQRADEVMVDLTVVFESVPDVLSLLRKKGAALGIVSTKFRYRIASILDREGLRDLFEVIVGGEDVTRHKPDPQGLLMAVNGLAIPLPACVYVGDSVIDAETARRAKIPFLAVLSGVTPEKAFHRYPVRKILRKLEELPEFMDGGDLNRRPTN
jgi:phosphoglycolate phosphatase